MRTSSQKINLLTFRNKTSAQSLGHSPCPDKSNWHFSKIKFFSCFLHWKFLWALFTSGLGEVTWSKDGSSLLKPVFLKIDKGYHAARECAAFFTIETKRSGKLPSSARAERHNLFCRGKVILRFRQNFCAVFPA